MRAWFFHNGPVCLLTILSQINLNDKVIWLVNQKLRRQKEVRYFLKW